MKSIIMPKLGFTQEESEIVAWIVSPGDYVESGDPIAEVSTDKVDMEIEAPANGYLAATKYKVGDVVPVTEVIALLAESEEELKQIQEQGVGAFQTAEDTAASDVSESADLPATQSTQNGSTSSGSTSSSSMPNDKVVAENITPVARRIAEEAGIDIRQVSSARGDGKVRKEDVLAFIQTVQTVQTVQTDSIAGSTNGKVRATPAARRLGRERGIDLHDIIGTGPNGRIQAADVETFTPQVKLPHVESAQPATSVPPLGADEARQVVVPMSKMRRAIGGNLQNSWQTIPHIMFSADMVLDNLLAVCGRYDGIGLNAAIIKTVAWTLSRHPCLNAHLVGDEMVQYRDVHIGMAVALEEGLIVPVVRTANAKGLLQLTDETRAIAQRARENSLRPTDMSGATFTISNLGMYGIDNFTAIINPPEVGILAIGGKRRTLMLDDDDQQMARSVATFTLSVDHRAIDGAVAAHFMADLRQAIEAPERMLL